MAIVSLGLVGSNSSKSAGTTLAVTNSSGSAIPAGSTLVLLLVFDNHASLTAATLSLSNSGGASWAQLGSTTGQGVTTSAGDGIWFAAFAVATASQINNGSTITTVTFGSSVVAKAALVRGYTGCSTTLRGSVATQASASTTPTVTTSGGTPQNGDLVIGAFANEAGTAGVPGDDADTTNGSWTTFVGDGTTGGGTATNVSIWSQDKIVTGNGNQTFNLNGVTTSDKVLAAFALQPASGSDVSGDAAATLTGSMAATATRTANAGAAATLTLTPTATATRTANADATATLTLTPTATATRTANGDASAVLQATASASAVVTKVGHAEATLTFSAEASMRVIRDVPEIINPGTSEVRNPYSTAPGLNTYSASADANPYSTG